MRHIILLLCGIGAASKNYPGRQPCHYPGDFIADLPTKRLLFIYLLLCVYPSFCTYTLTVTLGREFRVDGIIITEQQQHPTREWQKPKSVINTEHEHKYYARISEGHVPCRIYYYYYCKVACY